MSGNIVDFSAFGSFLTLLSIPKATHGSECMLPYTTPKRS